MIQKIKGILGKLNLKIAVLPLLIYFFFFHVPDINAVNEFPLILGAHRGSSVDYTENSLEALQESLENPDYSFIEFDIQYTKDKVIVVFHDMYLLRMQGKLGKISKLTYQELSDISSYHIPTYQEVMDMIGNEKRINIEIKSQGSLEDDKRLVDFIVQDCKERGILDLVLFSSISPDVISYISQKYPELKTGKIYLIHFVTYLPFKSVVENFYRNMEEIGADYIMLHGLNIKNYDLLLDLKPEDKTLVFWYFTDQMLIMQKDCSDRLW